MSAAPVSQQRNGAAAASLVLGLVSVLLGLSCSVLFGLAGPAAIILGKQGQRRADASVAMVSGRGMATAGFVLGVIGTVILVLQVAILVWLVASGRGLDVDTTGAGS